jgi:transglutaminase-like putative cysteine protease
MAVMLRTLGIATRVVNGFQMGEYNDAADVYTVRQSDAHSWVEVYFPATESWVTFDPTPAAGRPARESSGGLTGALTNTPKRSNLSGCGMSFLMTGNSSARSQILCAPISTPIAARSTREYKI